MMDLVRILLGHEKVLKETPHHAVCDLVLNLLSQIGFPHRKLRLGSGLSRYFFNIGTLKDSVGSKHVGHIAHTVGCHQFTIYPCN